jgi:hypothetical protein
LPTFLLLQKDHCIVLESYFLNFFFSIHDPASAQLSYLTAHFVSVRFQFHIHLLVKSSDPFSYLFSSHNEVDIFRTRSLHRSFSVRSRQQRRTTNRSEHSTLEIHQTHLTTLQAKTPPSQASTLSSPATPAQYASKAHGPTAHTIATASPSPAFRRTTGARIFCTVFNQMAVSRITGSAGRMEMGLGPLMTVRSGALLEPPSLVVP